MRTILLKGLNIESQNFGWIFFLGIPVIGWSVYLILYIDVLLSNFI